MKVSEIMTHGVACIAPQESLLSAALLMKKHDIGIVPVCDESGRISGILTDRDIVTRGIAEGRDTSTTPASECMTHGVICVAPDADVKEASELMARSRVRRLPVVQDDAVLGMLSLGDIAARQHLEKFAGTALGGVADHAHPKHWPQ